MAPLTGALAPPVEVQPIPKALATKSPLQRIDEVFIRWMTCLGGVITGKYDRIPIGDAIDRDRLGQTGKRTPIGVVEFNGRGMLAWRQRHRGKSQILRQIVP